MATSIGLNIGDPSAQVDDRGAQAATLMHDGAILLIGGTEGVATEVYDSGYVYTPDI